MKRLHFDLSCKITNDCTSGELLNVALTNKENYRFFSPILRKRAIDALITRLIQDEGRVNIFLEKDIALFCEKTNFIDSNSRAFIQVSGFEYALWSRNRPVIQSIYEYLVLEAPPKNIRSELLKQYQNWKEKGLSYLSEGRQINERFFSEDRLVEGLNRLENLIK